MKIYFAGAIRGGRDRVDTYQKINEILDSYGEVLDKHVADPNVNQLEERLSLEEIYNRDIKWLKECDIVVAEVSTPSLGVGYEIAYAEKLGKKIICIYEENINISAMIGGNKAIELISYKDVDELIAKLNEILK